MGLFAGSGYFYPLNYRGYSLLRRGVESFPLSLWDGMG